MARPGRRRLRPDGDLLTMGARNLGTTITGARRADERSGDARFVLHVVFPAELARKFELAPGDVTIGRDPGLDGVLLDHGTISRRHADLVWNATLHGHSVRDLGSRNGSWVDGVPATADARAMVGGSLLRLGDTLLVYEQDDGPTVEDAPDVSADEVPGAATGMRRLRAQLARAARDPAPV